MIFRRRRSTLQLIRPGAPGGKDVLIARVPDDATTLPAEIAARLTEEERAAFASYVTISAEIAAAQGRLDAHALPERVATAVEYLGRCEDAGERAMIRAGMADAVALLRRALRDAPGEAA